MEGPILKIVECSFELFSKFGIRSVTMADIARELGISKKTLYQYVDNKADLVEKVITCSIEEEMELVEHMAEGKPNAIEEMIGIANYVYQQLSMVNLRMIYDLKKYYRESWELVNTHHAEFIMSVIRRNLEQGIAEGYYRKEINIDVVSAFYLLKVKAFIDGELYSGLKVELKDIYLEQFYYHIFGIASEKGNEFIRANKEAFKNMTYVKV